MFTHQKSSGEFMKRLFSVLALGLTLTAHGQVWKTLPQGVRILGYRNVTTSKVKSNYNQFRSETSLGSQFRIDANTLNSLGGNIIVPGQDINADAYNKFLVGEYKVDASAQFNVQGFGFGYGLTDRVMLYAEVAYYNAQVKTNIKRTKKNTYSDTSNIIQNGSGGPGDDTIAEALNNLPDVDEAVIQSAITNHYGYQPIGDWYGSGYGDMETGLMAKVVDRGTWGVMLYPGMILPTGRQDDPDILQDVGFGDGQLDLFAEVGTGYIVNDYLNFGTTLRYTYQTPTSKSLRAPESQDFSLSARKTNFDVKYGDRLNWMLNSTFGFNDWLAFTPMYRFMYQLPSEYSSEQYPEANEFLSKNSDKTEHQVQLTTTLSSIQPFLKKKFLLPAQINMNLVQTIGGKNVPKVGRFEIELRMMF
jgi:hypothetical protein